MDSGQNGEGKQHERVQRVGWRTAKVSIDKSIFLLIYGADELSGQII